ncbi:MAG: PspA/IM30 family protein [Planctomycetota bacterium]|nr:PspA/IM30 family protein [Planctomycetota bacterium]
MGMFKRISDIISANLNEMTEKFEDPEKMLKQAIREMEESIAEVTGQTAKAMANEKTLSRELERNRAQEELWQERAVKAVEANDDELARKALARKHEHAQLATALEDQLAAAQQATSSMRRQLDGMKAKLAEAKRSLATLSARKRAADFSKRMEAQTAGLTAESEENAFGKFDRLKAKVEQAEAEAEALHELRSDRTAAAEVELPDENLDVSVELAELKRKMRK